MSGERRRWSSAQTLWTTLVLAFVALLTAKLGGFLPGLTWPAVTAPLWAIPGLFLGLGALFFGAVVVLALVVACVLLLAGASDDGNREE